MKVGKKGRTNTITGKHIGPVRGGHIGPKQTKRIIRRHHNLLKQKTRLESEIEKNGPDNVKQKELEQITEEIEKNGGIEKYQQASIAGQDPTRGGDSSKILVEWLKEEKPFDRKDLRLLEVGCLSPNNVVSKCGVFGEIDRIDLNSQHPLIKQQDFLTMPPPGLEKDKYDVISLSLVVNYVSDKNDRGKMLKLTTDFLSTRLKDSQFYPSLFLVLPAPCITNSRYFTEKQLDLIMNSLGYELVRRKETPRIIYWLWKFTNANQSNRKFKKQILNDGKSRNNFCVTLQ